MLNRQRKVIYDERRRVLEGEDLHEQVSHMIDDTVDALRRRRRPPRATPRTGTSTSCGARFKQLYPVGVTVEELEEAAGDRAGLTAEFLAEAHQGRRPASVRRRARSSSAREIMRELERRVVLSVLDRKWREHLYEMDYLQEGIGLRAMAQRDPLVEYQREGFDMFAAMMDGIKEESVGYLFNLEVQVEQQVEEVPVEDAAPVAGRTRRRRWSRPPGPRSAPRAWRLRSAPDRLHFSAPTVDGEGGVVEGDFDGRRRRGAASEADGLDARRAPQGRQGRAAPQEVAAAGRCVAVTAAGRGRACHRGRRRAAAAVRASPGGRVGAARSAWPPVSVQLPARPRP